MDNISDYMTDAAARFDRAIELGRPREAEFIAREAARVYPEEPGTTTLLDRAARLTCERKQTFPLTTRRQKTRRRLLSLLACSALASAIVLSWPKTAGVWSDVTALRGRGFSRRIPTWQPQPPGYRNHSYDLALLMSIHGSAGTPMGSFRKIDSRRLRELLASYGLLSNHAR